MKKEYCNYLKKFIEHECNVCTAPCKNNPNLTEFKELRSEIVVGSRVQIKGSGDCGIVRTIVTDHLDWHPYKVQIIMGELYDSGETVDFKLEDLICKDE